MKFSVTVQAGYQLDLSALSLYARRGTTDTGSIRYLAIRSDLTGAVDLYNAPVSAVRPGGTGNAFNSGADAISIDLTGDTQLRPCCLHKHLSRGTCWQSLPGGEPW